MGLSVLLHGFAGGGKSTLAGTAPGPRLVLDAEGGANWLQGPKLYWTDLAKLPEGDITPDTTVIVNVTTVTVLEQALQWLTRGAHPFKSVVLDSLSEMQKRFIDRIAGTNQMQQQQWGELLRTLEKTVRDLKDLKVHPNYPLDAIVMVCGSQKKEGEPVGPQLQGALANSIPFFFDLVGFAQLAYDESGQLVQTVQILPLNDIIAKDRTGILSRTYGPFLVNPNITQLIQATNPASGLPESESLAS